MFCEVILRQHYLLYCVKQSYMFYEERQSIYDSLIYTKPDEPNTFFFFLSGRADWDALLISGFKGNVATFFPGISKSVNADKSGFTFHFIFQFLMSAVLASYSLRCQPVDYSDNPIAIRVS